MHRHSTYASLTHTHGISRLSYSPYSLVLPLHDPFSRAQPSCPAFHISQSVITSVEPACFCLLWNYLVSAVAPLRPLCSCSFLGMISLRFSPSTSQLNFAPLFLNPVFRTVLAPIFFPAADFPHEHPNCLHCSPNTILSIMYTLSPLPSDGTVTASTQYLMALSSVSHTASHSFLAPLPT